MYAIVEIAGQQFKVAKDQQIFVHRLDEKEGANVTFDNVLLIDNDGKVNVGAPVIKGASVSAKVLEHMKSDKVIVFKKKRRKGYKKKQGHRQYMTSVQISSISEKGGAGKASSTEKKADDKKAAPAKKAEPKAEKKSTAKKTETKSKSEAKPKTETKSKSQAKPKTEAKKTAAKKSAPAEKKSTAKKAAPKKDADSKKEDK